MTDEPFPSVPPVADDWQSSNHGRTLAELDNRRRFFEGLERDRREDTSVSTAERYAMGLYFDQT